MGSDLYYQRVDVFEPERRPEPPMLLYPRDTRLGITYRDEYIGRDGSLIVVRTFVPR